MMSRDKIQTSADLLPGLSRPFGPRRFVITPKSVSFLSLHISVKIEDGNSSECRCVILCLIFHLSNENNNKKGKNAT